MKAADVLSEWNTEAAAARSAAGSAEGSWELSMEAALCDLIIVLCVRRHSSSAPLSARPARLYRGCMISSVSDTPLTLQGWNQQVVWLVLSL